MNHQLYYSKVPIISTSNFFHHILETVFSLMAFEDRGRISERLETELTKQCNTVRF